ncbi:hypothetical protein D9619_006151 [Psilocybe cf. subviscida]|uniref:Uncharacterized protein n=1 Tax=Psilocybe cf. subviscida TaxID=2480587 RepID=A0A8H5B4T8_9AGAR|nr:hypothetical protein D9619_006151 [Psilocybe cf. subviscida]
MPRHCILIPTESDLLHLASQAHSSPSTSTSRSVCYFPHSEASQRPQGPAFRLRGGGINIVDDDDADDDSEDDQPAHQQAVEDEDEYEDEEEDHDGDYEDDDEDDSSDGSAEEDDGNGGLEYADNPAVVHEYQQAEQLRYQQQGWTSDQHHQYQQEQYQQRHQQYWQEQQHHQQPAHPRVIALDDYVEEDDEEGAVYHKVEDTSHKRARPQHQQQQKASTSQNVVTSRYPRDQFRKQPYDPNAPPQVAFTEDELLGDLPDDSVSDYPRISNKGKGKAQAVSSDDEEEQPRRPRRVGQQEDEVEDEEDLYTFMERMKKPSTDDENMPNDDDDEKEPHPLGDTENWSDDAVAKWAGAVARLDKPVAPKPIYGEMGEQRFKDEMEKKRQEEIKAREPAPYKPDAARMIRQVGFDPVPVAPNAAPAVIPATPPPGPPPQVFPSQRRRGRNDEQPFIHIGVQVPPPRAGGLTSSSPFPSPGAVPSALSMSLSMGMGGQHGMHPGYSPGMAHQQLPPSLPQPIMAHQHRRQQQQAGHDTWAQNGLSARPITMPVLRRGRGRSRSLDSSRSPSLALRQTASSADYRAAKLRQEYKKSLQKQEERTRAQEAQKKAKMREERGVQTGSRTDGPLTVRTARTREEQREMAEQKGRSGKGKERAKEDDPSPTTSTNAMPPSTHRPLPVLRSYRSRRIGTIDLAALRPAALNITAHPSVGVDDRTVHSTATSAATSTTSLLLGGSGGEMAAFENWTPLERPPAEGTLHRSATTSSNVSPQAASPAAGHSPSGSWSRGGSGSRGRTGTPNHPAFAGAVAGAHPSVAAAAFQGTNPHFYRQQWGFMVLGGNKKSPQSSSEEEVAQPAEPAPPESPAYQQSSAPQAHSSSPRPAIASWVNRTFGFGSSSAQPANGQSSQSSGGAEASGSTGRRRSATNPVPRTIPRTPTAAQLLLQQSGYAQMTGNVYGREREWNKSGDDGEESEERLPRRQGFQRGVERERDRNRAGVAESSTAAPPQQSQPSRALQRQQEGQSSFRAHDQSFRGNQRQGQTRQRPSASNDNGGIISDSSSVEVGVLNMGAGHPIEHGASARTRAGGRGKRREEGARGTRAAGAIIPDAELQPTTIFEPQSTRSTRLPNNDAFTDANSPPSPPYLDAFSYPEPGRSQPGRRVRGPNGAFHTVDPNPNSRASTQPSVIRPTQPPTGASPRGFPLIVPPMQRRNRLTEGGSSHTSQRLAYSFTGPQTPSTSLLAASHFLGVNPARLTGGDRSEYGEDYDVHDLFSQDGGSVHSVPSDQMTRGRPALRANA